MVALAVTVIAGIAVVVDADAPPAQQVIAACVSDAAASLVLLALQGLEQSDPELFAIPLVDERVRPHLVRPSPPEHGSPHPAVGGPSDMRHSLSDEAPCVEGDIMALGAQNGRSKLTAKQVGQIRQLAALGGLADRRAIASHFGIAPSTVTDIVNRKLWPHLPAAEPAHLRPVRIEDAEDLIRTRGGAFGGPRGVVHLRPEVTATDGDDDDGPHAA